MPNLLSLPSFPSLKEEGQQGGGYDVRIQYPIAPIFLQFKIPRVIKRKHSQAPEFSLVSAPYFRMYLHPRSHSKQQELLLDLSSKWEWVFYATPEFDDSGTIDRLHRSSKVMDQSTFFRPEDIGALPDSKEHYVAYEAGRNIGYFCSEPHEIKLMHGSQIQQAIAAIPVGRSPDRDNFFQQLIDSMLQIARPIRRQSPMDRLEDSIGDFFGNNLETHAAYLAQVLFDCQLFIVHGGQQT